MGNDKYQVYFDKHEHDIGCLRSEAVYMTTMLDERVDAVSDTIGDLRDQVDRARADIDELFCLLGPVLDAMTDRPKQKWLWEIFEPNDIEIDFPYNI